MTLQPEQREHLEEAVRLIETVRTSLAGAEDFDSVRTDANLTTALTSAKAALAADAKSDAAQQG